MKAAIVECVIGVFGFNEKNEMVHRVLFPKDPERIAEAIGRIQGGKVIDELSELITKLRKRGYEKFVFESDVLAKSVHDELGVEVDVEKPSKAGESLRQNLGEIAVKAGYVTEPEEVRTLTHEVTLSLARVGVRRAAEKRDLLVIQAILTLDDLDRTLNLFSNRLREWYGLHFPELNSIVDKHDTYLRLVANLGGRSSFTEVSVEKEGLSPDKAKKVSNAAEASMGADASEEDVEEIRSLSKTVLELYDMRHRLERYIDEKMSEVAPNVRELVGSTLGARLIAATGGLQNLAAKPASTIQVLGAEKALFRSLRTGTRPPKHGIIFQYQEIHQAPRWQRGKIARALAGKLAIAARIDAYAGEYRGGELKADLDRRIGEIKEKYKETPQGKVKPRRIRGGRKGRATR